MAIWEGPVLVASVVEAEEVVEVEANAEEDVEHVLFSSATTQNQSVRSA